MLHFNELRYKDNNKTLVVDVAIDNLEYFRNVVLDSIIIDTLDTYIDNGPSSKPIFNYKVPSTPYTKVYSLPEYTTCAPIKTEDGSLCFTLDLNDKKQVRLEIPVNTLGINPNKDILFVYAIASGVPSMNTPCGVDRDRIVGTVINLLNIYKESLSFLRNIECANDCVIPKHFIDYILRFKALELCIRTGNYTLAIKYWKRFFLNIKVNITTKCGCHGYN